MICEGDKTAAIGQSLGCMSLIGLGLGGGDREPPTEFAPFHCGLWRKWGFSNGLDNSGERVHWPHLRGGSQPSEFNGNAVAARRGPTSTRSRSTAGKPRGANLAVDRGSLPHLHTSTTNSHLRPFHFEPHQRQLHLPNRRNGSHNSWKEDSKLQRRW